MIEWLVILSVLWLITIAAFVGLLFRQNDLEHRMDRMEYIISKEDGVAP